MAKQSRKRKTINQDASSRAPSLSAMIFGVGLPLLLALVTFLIYWPSLKSGFVYDSRFEILEEGFVTSISHLPAVLSLHVLGMNLMLGGRPGQMLYLMLNAAVWGKEPFGYHLSSNLLHAANVALLFILLRRLIATEVTGMAGSNVLKIQLASAVAVLIFAVHPISVEPVSGVSFSSDLLVMFFTLLALLAATVFHPDNFRVAMWAGGVGVLCAFAAVTCKESGLAVALLLGVYWFLFRRGETKLPWFLFLGSTVTVTAVFLAARFLFAPPIQNQEPLHYLGGSFGQVFLIQPRLWVFMMGKLIWPMQFSADYAPVEMLVPSTLIAFAILIVVVLLQGWLALTSRIGALGVAIYWLGLATVSNFIPLYRPLADRFYYLPMAGVAMQLLALLLMTLKSRWGFYVALAPCLVSLLPLTHLTVVREDVFADDFSLWSDTLQASPLSPLAHHNLGIALFEKGRVTEAIMQYQKALEINPNNAKAHYNLGVVLFERGQGDEAVIEYQKALEINPNLAEAHYNLGTVLFQKGEMDEAMAQYRKALEIIPNRAEAHNGLGVVLFAKGQLDDAIAQFQEAIRLEPNFNDAQNNLVKAKARESQKTPDK